MSSIRVAASFVALLSCFSATSLASSSTCSSIAATSDIEIEYQLGLSYTDDQSHYWSTGCSALQPSCIFAPSTADEVATIVKALNNNNESFAIKSGGHNPNTEFASIDGGPLINMKNLNEVTLDPVAGTVRVGPGNRWDDVQQTLDGTNYTIVGGRIGNVGVGGYMLGGGLSFLSSQYGWAASNFISCEVVLANGTIVTASNTTNSDLFTALKGGGNNYGIVTSYLVKAHKQGQVWGGNLFFTADKTADLLSAVRNFTDNYPDDKAAIILTSELTLASVVHIWVMFLFYDGPDPGTAFDIFTDIGPAINNCKTRSYAELLTYNNWSVLKGSVYTITTETTPVPPATPAGTQMMTDFYDFWYSNTKNLSLVPGLVGSIAFQPMPKTIVQKAIDSGPDLIDLDTDVNRIIFEFDYSYLLQVDDAVVDKATETLNQGFRSIVEKGVEEGTVPDAYVPLFMNDCYKTQDYAGRLRTRDMAVEVRDKYDPHGFFDQRTGGFKF
ncbi:FAD binding domain-containing protein [Saccharata proteae CBS 121410]|uniref:FAD binding domain-containing protein n=1 Tax=Saccharata proteae CBS 121410 TaxID=1314787 RepID=A0A9P4LZJ9_9PEZI|nr:FAD binding domain-containing protein [Saccharata proteae CBS 121410]